MSLFVGSPEFASWANYPPTNSDGTEGSWNLTIAFQGTPERQVHDLSLLLFGLDLWTLLLGYSSYCLLTRKKLINILPGFLQIQVI